MIENHMVVEEIWEPPVQQKCRMCKQIECVCEDEREICTKQ